MSDHGYGIEMADDEIETFLYARGTGTLSLAREGVAYAIPVSYGYDGDRDRCILDLGFGPESKKRSFLETTETGCLTVYEWHTPTDWRSVLLSGTLQRLDDEIDRDVEELYYEYAKDVEIAVFDHVPERIELQWYALEIEDRSGRSSR